MKQKIKLTPENYYSHKTDWEYMSVSLFKDFERCEAAALAKLKDDWQPTSNPIALIVGNYVHSFFESKKSHAKFLKNYEPVLFSTRGKTKGQLKRDFVVADEMISTLQFDPLFTDVYQGDKEVIVTGQIDGIDWKGKIDCLNVKEGYFCDLKTTRDIRQRVWSDEASKYVPFVIADEYVLQMAIYKKLLEQTYSKQFTPYIFAVSKQTPPDKCGIRIDEGRYQTEYNKVNRLLPEFVAVMNGETAPKYCGHCEYCRQMKQLHGFVEIEEIMK